jgi:hypothetical protein
MTGDENARARLEQLANSSPLAFHVSFATGIAESRYDRAAIAELTAAIKPKLAS